MSELSPLTEQEIAEMERKCAINDNRWGDDDVYDLTDDVRVLLQEVKRLRQEKAIRPQRGIPTSVSTDIYNLSAPGVAED